MRLLTILLATSIVVASVLMGGQLMDFVNAPSVLFVFGITGLGLMGSHRNAFPLIFRGIMGTLSSEESASLTHIAQTGNRLSIGSGWAGVLVGAIQMLQAVDDTSVFPDWFCPATAVCLLTALYGHTLSVVFWVPLEQSSKTLDA